MDFNSFSPTDILKKPAGIILLLFTVAIMSYLIAVKGLMIGIAFIFLPVLFIYLNIIFHNPKIGLWSVYVANFFILGVGRYVKGVPWGLTVDSLLMLTYVALFVKNFNHKINWKPANKLITYLSLIWFAYAVFQLINPEALSRVAWFYAMRGISLYMVLTVPLVLILFNKHKDMEKFLIAWAIFSIIGTLKGMMQKFIGPDPFEQAWLNAGADVTHVLFGKLRIFSFYSDAGQFGAAQGHAGLVFGIMAFHKLHLLKDKDERKKVILFAVASIFGLYGLLISGTRGALAVLALGGFLYLILTKNVKLLLAGIIMAAGLFVFLKYTTIGNSNYDINRIRSGLDPNNPSLQVRKRNQKILKGYLASRPFGGGIGSSGDWGKRFSPNGFLSNVPTDSWYVIIWAEQGIVGLLLHLSILFTIIGKLIYETMFRLRNKKIKFEIIALGSGIFGIMGASYGNAVLGQMPTGILIYSSMAFIFMARNFEKELDKKTTKAETDKVT